MKPVKESPYKWLKKRRWLSVNGKHLGVHYLGDGNVCVRDKLTRVPLVTVNTDDKLTLLPDDSSTNTANVGETLMELLKVLRVPTLYITPSRFGGGQVVFTYRVLPRLTVHSVGYAAAPKTELRWWADDYHWTPAFLPWGYHEWVQAIDDKMFARVCVVMDAAVAAVNRTKEFCAGRAVDCAVDKILADCVMNGLPLPQERVIELTSYVAYGAACHGATVKEHLETWTERVVFELARRGALTNAFMHYDRAWVTVKTASIITTQDTTLPQDGELDLSNY